MAARRKERSVDELYNATEVIRKPKLPPHSEKRLGKRSMRRKARTRAESGTCNVCSAPCSSCMHLKLACMGTKDDEFSDENCRITATSQNSINENEILPVRNRACDSLQHTTSEASNLLSVNSSHDSLSENAESKANIRCSDIADALGGTKMLPKLTFGGNVARDQLYAKPQCMVDQTTFSNDYPKVVEGHDDNISCVSRADDGSTAVNLNNKNVDKKNLSCSSVLVSSLGPEGSGKSLISPKPELLEIPLNGSDAGTSSPKVQSGCPFSITNGTHMEEDMKLDRSKGSSQFHPKTEVEVKRYIGDQQDEKFKCSNQVEQDEKSNESVELPDMQDHVSQSVSGDESDESEIVEHDVKVCDICGDAGREDLLAICSKCCDGAEHTYCMREMLQKVPEGDWLCEECKLAEETENQKQDAEGRIMNKESIQSSMKRPAETIEVALASKRQAIESSFGSPKSSSPTRTAALSRDSSFKGLDKGKVKLAHQTASANHSSMDISETARSSYIVPRLQTTKGRESTLLKSNSFNTFNSKPKVKLVDEVPQKQKGNRDLEMKEGTARMMSKSMSFRSVNSGRSNVAESKVKMLSSKFSQGQDIKGLKQVKERNALEHKSLSKLERPLGSSVTTSSNASGPKVNQKLTPRGEGVMVSSACNNSDSKASLSDGKSGGLLRSTSSLARKGAEIPASSVRSSLANGMSNAFVEQKLNQVSPKDEPSSSSSWTAERPSNNIDDNLQDGLSRSRESSNQSEKSRESSVNRSRPSVTGLKTVTCLKCKEIGHTAEFCSIVSPRASGADTSARSVREDMGKGSKLKAAIEAAMLKKPGIFRKKKESDESDGLSSSNVDVTSEIASHDQSHDQFSVSNKTRYMISDEGRDEGQANLGSSSFETSKQMYSNNVKQLNIHSTDAINSFKVADTNSLVPSIGKPDRALTAKPLFSMMLTIPEHEYIWQGALEVRRCGKILDLYNGIQAHLSTCASPKVLEVVNQFPHKITVDEVPRLSTWPRQFHENGAKEDNIALYLFAKDLESYEKSYRNLLDNMIKRDLALKVSFDGVEFLIFPSTQLPEDSQRWNMLFFLWGVFRGRRSSSLDSLKKSDFPSSYVVPLDISTPDKPCILNGDLDIKGSSSQTDLEQQNDRLNYKSSLKNATNSALLCSENRCTGSSQEEYRLSTQAAGANSGSNSREGIQKHADTSFVRDDSSSVKVFQTSKQDEGVRVIADKEKLMDRMKVDRDEVKVERNLNEDPTDMDTEASSGRGGTTERLDCWQSNSKKRSYLDLSEAPQTSSSTSQKLPWVNVNGIVVDGGSISKKPKTVFHEQYSCISMRDGTSLTDGFASQIRDLGSSSSAEGKSCERPADEKVIHEDLGTAERYFFPVESRRVKDIRMGANSVPWKEYSSNDENQFRDVVPNLELALGAETKPPNKGIVPFFVGMVEKNNTQNKTSDKVTDKEEEDGVSASLSLSLSFPFPDKEQTVKPVSKTEQLLPERRHVNTSLLLFGGFPDK
ncbi:uncharacterized protein LOC8272795 isoform X3 [Ricinus communis]|uniref:uncharacterized protein LOC8272795 isoform X3 n=1 Tax=Ricinus communis TaxID=3988 RepID=UPI00201A89C7|nr:uncharacterized protein LOC8272795 isoform X3 [Ricinus communis]